VSDFRAQLILAEARGDVTAIRQASSSPDPTTRAAALGALARCGELNDTEVLAAFADDHATVRCRAIELSLDMTTIELIHHLDDDDDLVVETTAWALGERGAENDEFVISRLSEVAASHEVSICREAAVAALGAIGSPTGLSTILRAMSDRAPVRRRAVLALAPFDGDEVTAALNRALSDRDRQVRQAAEDLLGT